jgi:thiamine biosynthesis lipoprotein
MGMQWTAWGTTVRVELSAPGREAAARRLVTRCVADAERAADLDRPGAQVHRSVRAAGRPVRIGPVLADLVAVAIGAAERSAGAVDPTVGAATLPIHRALHRARRRDLHRGRVAGGSFPVCSALPTVRPRPAAGWRSVEWTEQSLGIPAGACLDLTATAKARTAQRAASLVAGVCGVGALVEIGGDVATAGPAPDGGWTVVPEHAGAAVVRLDAGMAVASCRSAGIVDPLTGRRVVSPWLAVAVIGTDPVTAKATAVTALVQGAAAAQYLDRVGAHAVLVPDDRIEAAISR